MERIFNARHLGELCLTKNIDDYWLLVVLNCVVAMESAGVSPENNSEPLTDVCAWRSPAEGT